MHRLFPLQCNFECGNGGTVNVKHTKLYLQDKDKRNQMLGEHFNVITGPVLCSEESFSSKMRAHLPKDCARKV